MLDFIDIEYLNYGNTKQKKAYIAIQKLEIMKTLNNFNPLLAGTIPIDIDIDNSDLDIICEVHDFKEFETLLKKKFGHFKNFTIKLELKKESFILVSSFHYEGFIFEIFAQPIKTIQQNAYKHMVVENRILKLCKKNSKEIIRNLKKNGYKTEPAFGVYLNLSKNPYEFLLSMYDWSNDEIIDYLKKIDLL